VIKINDVDSIIRNSIDFHVHTGPSLLPRIGTSIQMAKAAFESGVRGWVIKSHHESSVGRAKLVESAITGFKCWGGVVLNEYVGGLNPQAVRAALLTGGKLVWFPTLHADYHASKYGKGSAGVGIADASNKKGIKVVNENGTLLLEAKECIDITGELNGIIGTGHVSPKEIEAIVDYCNAKGIPVIVNHPYFIIHQPIEFFASLAEKGSIIEVCAASLMPVHPEATLEKLVSLIHACTPQKCLLASDGGSIQSPAPQEMMRFVSYNLIKTGITEEDIKLMLIDNPARLLDIS